MTKKDKRINKQEWIQARVEMYMDTQSIWRSQAMVKAKLDWQNRISK